MLFWEFCEIYDKNHRVPSFDAPITLKRGYNKSCSMKNVEHDLA